MWDVKVYGIYDTVGALFRIKGFAAFPRHAPVRGARAYPGPEELHEADAAVDTDIHEWLEALGRDEVHHERAALCLKEVQVVGGREAARLCGGDGRALEGSDCVVVAHLRRSEAVADRAVEKWPSCIWLNTELYRFLY